jgi:quercetin dioxygenase-like cupin family protein
MNVRLVMLVAALMVLAITAQAAATEHEIVTPAFAHTIPNVPGKTITALMVTYKPGGTSLAHRHGSAFVVAYVLSGVIRSQLEGGEAKVYHAGESWTEAPGAHHVVSDNASRTESASLLAIFIADNSDKQLVTYDKP